jgi:hypothetical protein
MLWGNQNPEDSLLNKFIIENKLGTVREFSTQVYRIAERLARAGLVYLRGNPLSSAERSFIPTEEGINFVIELMSLEVSDWPYSIEVVNGVPDWESVNE